MRRLYLGRSARLGFGAGYFSSVCVWETGPELIQGFMLWDLALAAMGVLGAVHQ